jgi:hypothetical protein
VSDPISVHPRLRVLPAQPQAGRQRNAHPALAAFPGRHGPARRYSCHWAMVRDRRRTRPATVPMTSRNNRPKLVPTAHWAAQATADMVMKAARTVPAPGAAGQLCPISPAAMVASGYCQT